MLANYINHLDDALRTFCDHHLPCMFSNDRGKKTRCVNVRVGHQSKGHQSKDGKVFAAGDYESTFSFEAYKNKFRNDVYILLVVSQRELASRGQQGVSEKSEAARIHRDFVLTHFFTRFTTTAQNSHLQSAFDGFLHSQTACFCCLFGQAEVPLPCGHIICTACLTTYGRARGDAEYELDGCPFGPQVHARLGLRCSTSTSSWRIQLKPQSAGVRILTLDG